MSRFSGWTAEGIAAINGKPRSKYGSKKVQIDGRFFDSKAEGARYVQLKTMQQAGVISELECQPKFTIGIRGIWICDVYLDFGYRDKDTVIHYEDVKGKDNALSVLKRKMVEAEYGIKVEIVR